MSEKQKHFYKTWAPFTLLQMHEGDTFWVLRFLDFFSLDVALAIPAFFPQSLMFFMVAFGLSLPICSNNLVRGLNVFISIFLF